MSHSQTKLQNENLAQFLAILTDTVTRATLYTSLWGSEMLTFCGRGPGVNSTPRFSPAQRFALCHISKSTLRTSNSTHSALQEILDSMITGLLVVTFIIPPTLLLFLRINQMTKQNLAKSKALLRTFLSKISDNLAIFR